jgi:hypothetical protein
LGIFGFSAVSISNAKRVKDALEKTAQEELTDVKKERVAAYVNMLNIRYAGKLNTVEIQNEPGLKVIADADEANKIIRVNALALMKLDQDLVDNIILNHELVHIKGTKSEFITHLNNIFSFKSVKSYLFGKKSLVSSLLKFYSALDNYKACKNFDNKDKKAETMYVLIKSINILQVFIDRDVIKKYLSEDMPKVLEELESDGASELLKDYKTLDGDSEQDVKTNLEKYKEILEVYKVKEAADRKKEENEALAETEIEFDVNERKGSLKTQIAQAIENLIMVYKELFDAKSLESQVEDLRKIEVSKTEADFEEAVKKLGAIKFPIKNAAEAALINFKKAIEDYKKSPKEHFDKLLNTVDAVELISPENFGVKNKLVSILKSRLSDYKEAVKKYHGNNTGQNHKVMETAENNALEAIKAYIDERMKILEGPVEQVCKIIEKLYGISPEEEIQQVAMILKYIRMKKEGEPDVEKFLTDDTLVNVQEQSKNYPKNIINFSEIIKWKKENGKKTDIPIVFNLALAGIGENLKRTEFLKAWYVLQVRERKVEKKEMEAKSDVEREEAKAERKKISEAVESMYFLQAEWYNEREYGQEDITYEDLVKMGADKIEESYGLVLDIMTQDKNEQLKAGDPQLKTKALDIGLRVQERNGYWTIKSVAEIILDDFIAKKNAGFAGLTLNLVTNNESLEDVKKLLKRISSTGKTYEEELINLGVLKKVYGKGYEGYTDTDGLSIDGLYLQKTHPTIQYDEKTGEMNFFYHQELINHGSFLAKLVRQMVESGDEEDTFWYFGNSDNFLAGQFPLEVFDWMDDTKTPAVIVVTEKGTSEGNKKGGIPMIIRTAASALGTPVPIFKIIEIAQVKQDKELEAEFQAAEKAFFNTNIIILKKLEIISAIKKLKDALEKQEVVDIISGTYPDLKDKETIIKYLYVLGDTIVNDKSTNKKEKYVKLEIAIASSLMELSNLVSLATGETLLKFVYFTDKETQEMFGPIKKEENFYETLEERVVIESIKSSVIKKIVEFIFGIINRFLSTHIAIDPYVSQKIVKTTSAVIKGITNKIFENLYIHTDFAKYHELIGLEDVLIYDGEGTDEEFAIKTAVKKAALGKNVNVIMPLDTNTDITEMSAENTGDSHIYKKTLAQGNGFKVNVYYYVNDKEPAAYNAYKYVVDNLDGAVGIVENGSNISYSAITETSPLAAVFAITLNTEQNDQAKEKGYLHFTNNLSESEKLEIAGKEIKGKRDGNDMRNQVALAAAIDVLEISQDIFDSAEYNNFTTFIVEVNVSGYEARKAQLKNFIAAGHAKDKNIVLRFKAGDLQQAKEAVQIVENDLRSLRANLSKKDIKRLEISAAEYAKADSRGIDGIIFDFNALSKDEVDNALTGTSKISSAIIRENVDGIAVVETNYYSNKFREGNIKNFSDLAAEIGPKNGTLFNESTVDVNAVAKDVENAMESDKGMIIIRSEIIKALKKNNINFDFNAFLLRIVTIWVLVVKKTPEGRFRAGKRAGLAVDIDTQIDEKGIYEILRQMRSASSEQYSEIVENMAKKLENTKTRQLASLIKQTPDQEQNLVFQEALGYLQGVLERLEANKHMKEVNFAVRIDTDIYRSMLVEARMYELLDGINVPERKDQSYASADDELQRADYIVYKDTAQTREEMREVINILTSFVENAKPDNPDRSIALAKLLELLNVYSKEVKVSNDYTKNTITNEGVRAMLSAA